MNIGKYGASEIESFAMNKRDITPVKNAISLSVSSGFVEGNNNKFKVLKRIVYGRSGLVNLEKKCKLAFLPKNQDFCTFFLVVKQAGIELIPANVLYAIPKTQKEPASFPAASFMFMSEQFLFK